MSYTFTHARAKLNFQGVRLRIVLSNATPSLMRLLNDISLIIELFAIHKTRMCLLFKHVCLYEIFSLIYYYFRLFFFLLFFFLLSRTRYFVLRKRRKNVEKNGKSPIRIILNDDEYSFDTARANGIC